MNILVTGGAGYIGSHTIRKLRDAGHTPVVFDDFSSGHRAAVRDFEVIEGSLADRDALHQALSGNAVDAIIHFAGSIEAGESMTDPARFYRNNVVNGLNLLDTMVSHDVKRIIFSSTAAVYGEPKTMPITENAPKRPTNVYGLTKLMFEQILESYARAYGIRSVSLRYFNAAGADPSGEIGADHRHKTHLLTVCMLAALGKRDAVRIFGTDYPTKDGTGVRDYIHVSDLADAHVLALDFLIQEDRSDTFNLGNGTGTSVREMIDSVKRVTGTNFAVTEEPRREGDPAELFASSRKAMETLGWTPVHADIDDIVETAWQFHRTHPDGFSEQ